MFEDKTFDSIMKGALGRVPDTFDKRQGSMIYDMLAPYALELSYAYIDLDNIINLLSLPRAQEEYLDEWGWTFGVTRNPAKSAVYAATFKGRSIPEPGARFFDSETALYFVVIEREGALVFEAEKTGVETNTVHAGSDAIPVTTIRGLEAASFGELIEPGTDAEDDEDYRERLHEAVAGPAENGNRQHYKTWCESVAGVGRAKIVPLFAGPNTVMGVLFGTQGEPATPAIVEQVQEYIDPIRLHETLEYEGEIITVGDGMGNGVANVGAHFYAAAARARDVTVSVNVLLSENYTLEEATAEIKKTLAAYFEKIALSGTDEKNNVVRITNIGAQLVSLPSVVDYDNLLLNGKPESILVGTTEAAVLKGVEVGYANISR